MQILTAIRIFVLAMQHGSLAGAARHLNMSTASVSRQVGALEAQLKLRLFNRGTRKLTPTEAGEMLLRRSRPLIEEIDEMIDSISLLESQPRGLLRVNIRGIAASRQLVPALPRFLAANPDVAINLFVTNDEDIDLIADNIDVDIRYTRPDSPDLVAKLLAPSRLALVASAASVACGGRTPPRDVQELAAFDAVLFDSDQDRAPWQFVLGDGQVQSWQPKGRLRVNDGAVLRSAILAGVGIGMMPYHEVDRELADGELVQLLPEWRIVHPVVGGEGIFAVYQRSRYQPGKLLSFLGFLPTVFDVPA